MFEKLKNLFKEETDLDDIQDDSPVVFEGTTAELLEMTKQQVEAEAPQEKCEMTKYDDKVWLNLEFLKMALEIETSKNQKLVYYVDVGNLPRQKAEQYMKDLMEKFDGKAGDFWLPRREGGRGTELNSLPGRVTLEGVLETAKKLKSFATE
jgi:hypothetical protein